MLGASLGYRVNHHDFCQGCSSLCWIQSTKRGYRKGSKVCVYGGVLRNLEIFLWSKSPRFAKGSCISPTIWVLEREGWASEARRCMLLPFLTWVGLWRETRTSPGGNWGQGFQRPLRLWYWYLLTWVLCHLNPYRSALPYLEQVAASRKGALCCSGIACKRRCLHNREASEKLLSTAGAHTTVEGVVPAAGYHTSLGWDFQVCWFRG